MWRGWSLWRKLSKKLVDAGHVKGDDPAEEKTPVAEDKCCVCGSANDVKRCSQCKATLYCSKQCQKDHRPHHDVYCSAIESLEKHEREKLYRGYSLRQCQIDFRTKKRLIKLVGEKPVLSCVLGEEKVEVEVLWDTGSMVCLCDRDWLEKNFPDVEVQSVSDFLEIFSQTKCLGEQQLFI